ncbi:hypothetical protein MCOR25_007890 [Pyricularia grisea]|nr:hypothetical protein MCOR25_007890 [Pyricularia grisea]
MRAGIVALLLTAATAVAAIPVPQNGQHQISVRQNNNQNQNNQNQNNQNQNNNNQNNNNQNNNNQNNNNQNNNNQNNQDQNNNNNNQNQNQGNNNQNNQDQNNNNQNQGNQNQNNNNNNNQNQNNGDNSGNNNNNNQGNGNADNADAGGAADFGTCVPTISFEFGRGNRDADEGTFLPLDPAILQGQSDALNPNIITNRVCDQLGAQTCGANQAAVDLCLDAKAQVAAAGTKDATTADLFNGLLGF